MTQTKPLLFLIFLAFFIRFSKAFRKLGFMFISLLMLDLKSHLCRVCHSKIKGSLVLKFSDKVLDLKQFNQQIDSIYSVILRYMTLEGPLKSTVWSATSFRTTPWPHTILSILLSDESNICRATRSVLKYLLTPNQTLHLC